MIESMKKEKVASNTGKKYNPRGAGKISKAQEPAARYVPASQTFTVKKGGKSKQYVSTSGYGYFIPSLKKVGNVAQVAQLVENGIPSKEIEPLIGYLNFKVPDVAKAAAVSASTVTRWKPGSSIGIAGSGQFFKIDEIVRKGVQLFGSEQEFKDWLNNPNMALGNVTPRQLITSSIGAEMVDEALDALAFGNVM